MRFSLPMKGGIGVFPLLALALLGAVLIPLSVAVFAWRFVYAGNSTKALGLAQIRGALDGAAELIALHDASSGASEQDLKRSLNGPIVRVLLGPSSDGNAIIAAETLFPGVPLRFGSGGAVDSAGTTRGAAMQDGSWTIDDPSLVSAAAAVWERLSQEERRALANGPSRVRIIRDSSLAVIRVGMTGYIWTVSAAPNMGDRCYEVFHPQLEGVEVTDAANAAGEKVGAVIASLSGRLASGNHEEIVRYDYYWKNPEDKNERKKIVLLRYIPSHDFILCAGLYEDEYFLPARAAESFSILLVATIVSIALTLSFIFAVRISRALNSLAASARRTADEAPPKPDPGPTGIRELDTLAESMRYMRERIASRENALHRELQEKNALLEEVYHRVKNNLTVIAGLINLQKDQAKGTEAVNLLSLLQARINSMAIVYQQLMESSEFSRLPFDETIRGILAYHQSDCSGPGCEVLRSERLDPVVLDLETAVPFGLAANELIANAYEHGFPQDRIPELTIELFREKSSLVFAVTDNGEGLADGYTEKTGFLLVRALSAQLRGEFSLTSPAQGGHGTVARIRAPV